MHERVQFTLLCQLIRLLVAAQWKLSLVSEACMPWAQPLRLSHLWYLAWTAAVAQIFHRLALARFIVLDLPQLLLSLWPEHLCWHIATRVALSQCQTCCSGCASKPRLRQKS